MGRDTGKALALAIKKKVALKTEDKYVGTGAEEKWQGSSLEPL